MIFESKVHDRSYVGVTTAFGEEGGSGHLFLLKTKRVLTKLTVSVDRRWTTNCAKVVVFEMWTLSENQLTRGPVPTARGQKKNAIGLGRCQGNTSQD